MEERLTTTILKLCPCGVVTLLYLSDAVVPTVIIAMQAFCICWECMRAVIVME